MSILFRNIRRLPTQHSGIRLAGWFAAVYIMAIASMVPAVSREHTLTTPHFVIDYRDIGAEQAKEFANYAESMLTAIAAYLNRKASKKFRISIGNQFIFPDLDVATDRIVIPANRIRRDAAGPPDLRGRGTSIVLILAAMVAPSGNRHWKQFLEVGLGTYLQEKIGAKSDQSYPNMGRDLHEETVRLAASYGRFIPLGEAEAARVRRTRLTRTRRLAYLQEGSFVRHLIETHGLTRFLKVYEGGTFFKSYGREAVELEREWLEMLESIRP